MSLIRICALGVRAHHFNTASEISSPPAHCQTKNDITKLMCFDFICRTDQRCLMELYPSPDSLKFLSKLENTSIVAKAPSGARWSSISPSANVAPSASMAAAVSFRVS